MSIKLRFELIETVVVIISFIFGHLFFSQKIHFNIVMPIWIVFFIVLILCEIIKRIKR